MSLTIVLNILSMNVDDHPAYRPSASAQGKNHAWIPQAFPELFFVNRFSRLTQLLKSFMVDHQFFVLQEIGSEALEYLKLFFFFNGYEHISSKYNNDAGSCNYLVAYKKSDTNYTIAHVNTKMIYFTTSGLSLTGEQRKTMSREEKIEHGYFQEFEKSAQVTFFEIKQFDTGTDTSMDLTIVNTHPGLTNEHRLKSMTHLMKEIDGLKNVIIMGDFNQFDFTKNDFAMYEPQRDIIISAGTVGYTSFCKHDYSFAGHPYDIIRFFSKDEKQQFDKLVANVNEKKLNSTSNIRDFCLDIFFRIPHVSSRLDDVFISNTFDKQINSVECTLYTLLGNDITNLTHVDRFQFEEKDKKLIKQGCYRPSDHCATSTKIVFQS